MKCGRAPWFAHHWRCESAVGRILTCEPWSDPCCVQLGCIAAYAWCGYRTDATSERGSGYYARNVDEDLLLAGEPVRSVMSVPLGVDEGQPSGAYDTRGASGTMSDWREQNEFQSQDEAMAAVGHITNIVRAAAKGCPDLLKDGRDEALNGLLGARQQLIGWLQTQGKADDSRFTQNDPSIPSSPQQLSERDWSGSITDDYRDTAAFWAPNHGLEHARRDSFSDSSDETTPPELRTTTPFTFHLSAPPLTARHFSRDSSLLDPYGSFDTNSLMPLSKRPCLSSSPLPAHVSPLATASHSTLASSPYVPPIHPSTQANDLAFPNSSDSVFPSQHTASHSRKRSPRVPPLQLATVASSSPSKTPENRISLQDSNFITQHSPYAYAYASVPPPASHTPYTQLSNGQSPHNGYVTPPAWVRNAGPPAAYPALHDPPLHPSPQTPGPLGIFPTQANAAGAYPPTGQASQMALPTFPPTAYVSPIYPSPAPQPPNAPTYHLIPAGTVFGPGQFGSSPFTASNSATNATSARSRQPFPFQGNMPNTGYPSQPNYQMAQFGFQPPLGRQQTASAHISPSVAGRQASHASTRGSTYASAGQPSPTSLGVVQDDNPLITKTVSKTGRPLPPVSTFRVKPSKCTPLPQIDPNVAPKPGHSKLPASLASFVAPGLMDTFDWRKPTPAASKKMKTKIANQAPEGNVKLSDFAILGVLGTGTFGKVHLCQHVASRQYYCMKVLKKQTIYRFKQMDHIVNEKQLLAQLKYPGIVQLFSTFVTADSLMLLMEYVPGGELFYYIRKFGRLSEDVARFYVAELVLTILHLHERQIVYRDLKPENILLDSGGHLKLADFGFAKRVVDKTWTMCGTPDYLAPEIITGRGHDTAVDWWSLGVLIFEMLAGYPPFTDKDMGTLFRKIQEPERLLLPPDFSQEAADLVRRLLVVDPSRRLGNIHPDVSDIQTHPWFRPINWETIRLRSQPGPIIPFLPNPSEIALQEHQDPNEQPPPAPLPIPDDVQRLFDRF